MGTRTGAPGDSDCTTCHSGTVNSGPGVVGISAPVEYMPDDTLDLSISLSSAGMVKWGFEITALDASNQPAGQILVSDAVNTQISTPGRQYLFQTSTGSFDGTANASPGWSFK